MEGQWKWEPTFAQHSLDFIRMLQPFLSANTRQTGASSAKTTSSKVFRRMEHLPCEERLTQWHLFSWEKQGFPRCLITAWNYLGGGHLQDEARFFSIAWWEDEATSVCWNKRGSVRIYWKNCFTTWTVVAWGNCVVSRFFEIWVDKALSSLLWP